MSACNAFKLLLWPELRYNTGQSVPHVPMTAASSSDDKSRIAAQPTRLKFWGVRGSIPTPGPTTVHYGGNTSCVEVRADGQIIILDAGTGPARAGGATGARRGTP